MTARRQKVDCQHCKSAQLGVPQTTPYEVIKSGVYAITHGPAAKLMADGVTVNSATPKLNGIVLIEECGDRMYDLDRIVLGGLAVPEDSANACLFYVPTSRRT